MSGHVVLLDDVVDPLDVLPREDVAPPLLPHAAVVGGLGKAEVVVADGGSGDPTLQTFLKTFKVSLYKVIQTQKW